jgi:hypothetical protein
LRDLNSLASSQAAPAPAAAPWPELDESTRRRAVAALEATLAYSRAAAYTGWSKHDALNSPWLEALLGGSRPGRLLATQAVTRAPVNLRPLLGVRRATNAKGIALFAQAYLERARGPGEQEDLAEACRLLDWLLAHPAEGHRGLSWGYPYPWQDVGFFAPRHSPNRVVTCWIGLAIASAARRTGEPRYLGALPAIADFLTGEPRVLHDSPSMKCYSYVPSDAVDWAVMDVPALVGAFLAEAGVLLGRDEQLAEAERLVRWVVDKQTAAGAWYYTHPPGDSHVKHDNYHTAIILDSLDRYRRASGDRQFEESYRAGLGFYREQLFSRGWAPRWMSHREYPHDVHGAASAVLCFVRAADSDARYRDAAVGVLRWALDRLYDPRGYFYYQEGRFFRKRFCLMRWCNGWMSWALAAALRAAEGRPAP